MGLGGVLECDNVVVLGVVGFDVRFGRFVLEVGCEEGPGEGVGLVCHLG